MSGDSYDYQDEIKLLEEADVGAVQAWDSGGLFAQFASPFQVPEFLGWARRKKRNGQVYYVSPCGKILTNYANIFKLLKEKSSKLSVEQFTLDADVSTALIMRRFDDKVRRF